MAGAKVVNTEEELQEFKYDWRVTTMDKMNEIHKETFKRWINAKLSKEVIHDLEYDLSDGLILLELVEELTGEDIPFRNYAPLMRSRRLENVAIALDILRKNQVHFVNIDPSNIVDGDLKLILGLIWTLISKFAIDRPIDNVLDSCDQASTPRQRIKSWLQEKMKFVLIKNFSSQWRDGILLGALVNAVCPGLCSSWKTWDETDNIKNIKQAMKAAEFLGLIEPYDLLLGFVDEKALLTYLSQFTEVNIKLPSELEIPNDPEWYAHVFPENVVVSDFSTRVKLLNLLCYTTMNEKTTIWIDGRGAPDESQGDFSAKILRGNDEIPVKITNFVDHTTKVSFTPRQTGTLFLQFYLKDKQLLQKPYKMHVFNESQDELKVTGPGLHGGILGVPNDIIIPYGRYSGNIVANVSCNLDWPAVSTHNDVLNEVINLSYTPYVAKPHKLSITCDDIHILGSPYTIPVFADKNCYLLELDTENIREDVPTQFQIFSSNPRETCIEFLAKKSFMKHRPVSKKISNNLFSVNFTPPKAGTVLEISVNHQGEQKCHHLINVLETFDHTKVKLIKESEDLVASMPYSFLVDTSLAGGAILDVCIHDEENRLYSVEREGIDPYKQRFTFVPADCKEYHFDITFDSLKSELSFSSKCVPPQGSFPERCILNVDLPPELEFGKIHHIVADTKNCGNGHLTCCVYVKTLKFTSQIEDLGEGLYMIEFATLVPGTYNIQIKFGGKLVPNGEITRVVSLDQKLRRHKITFTNVPIPHRAGNLIVEVNRDFAYPRPCQFRKNGNNTLDVDIDYVFRGYYQLFVRMDGLHVDGSPFNFKIDRRDVCPIAYGTGLIRATVGEPAEFMIAPIRSQPTLSVEITGPNLSGFTCQNIGPTDVMVTYIANAPGEYKINLMENFESLGGSPFLVQVVPKEPVQYISNVEAISSYHWLGLPSSECEHTSLTFQRN